MILKNLERILNFQLRNKIWLVIPIFVLQACSASKDSVTSKAWHNMNARFNSYFLANEAIKEMERELFQNRKEDYNRVLDVIPITDTNTFQAYDEKMEDAIKKLANIKNRHENSQLLYPAYVLIGKARYYRREFEDALNTFKYVNSRSDDSEASNKALIELMLTYIQLEDFRSARTALNAFRKRSLDKENKIDYLIARGHFFREQDDLIETAKSLGSAVKLMPHGEPKARAHFILGQIYQKINSDRLAYRNYRQVLKNNPPYELSFYAKLYLAQVSNLKNQGDVKKVNRYFKRLLKDAKNQEYQDKIYYEMGLFALRQEDVEGAIQKLNQSLVVSSNNPVQKAYSYLKLGEIYYAELQNYETAKSYYDSVMTSLPPNAENYKAVKRRQETLEEFVKQLNIYRTQDSLQRLAKIPEPQRGDYISSQLKLEENKRYEQEQAQAEFEQKQAALAAKKQQNANTRNPFGNQGQGQGSGQWYFYNPTSVELGLEAFRDRWGRRPLVDNWRRAEAIKNVPDSVRIDTIRIVPPEIMKERIIAKRVETRKKEIYDALPETEEDFQVSDEKIEEATFALGKIYKFNLEEPKNAIKYFDILLDRFPETRYEAEVLYYLYLLYDEISAPVESGKAKQKLLDKHPNSLYAKRIVNPNWEEEVRASEAAVKAAYEQAYHLYEVGRYEESLAEIQKIREAYPSNALEDRLMFLEYLISVKLDQDRAAFLKNMEAFINNYPSSELIPKAEALLKELQ